MLVCFSDHKKRGFTFQRRWPVRILEPVCELCITSSPYIHFEKPIKIGREVNLYSVQKEGEVSNPISFELLNRLVAW